MTVRTGRRSGERGLLLRGCCFALFIPMLVLVALVVLTLRATAAPDLGADPAGPSHGSTEALIAAALAGSAATQLAAGEHASVTLSERDLTVMAAAHNPSPTRFRNPQSRVRGGYLVVSAQTSVGPLGVTGIARYSISFADDTGVAELTASSVDYAVGQLSLPGWVADRIDPRGSSTLNLTGLFGSNPALQTLAKNMECVAVQNDGVHVGFHRPGSTADPTTCAAVAATGA